MIDIDPNIDLNDKELLIKGLVRALDAAILQMKEDALRFEQEWGTCRTFRQLADDGELPKGFCMAIGAMVHAAAMGYKP